MGHPIPQRSGPIPVSSHAKLGMGYPIPSHKIKGFAPGSLKEPLVLYMSRLYSIYAAAGYSILCYEIKKRILYMPRFYSVYAAVGFVITCGDFKPHSLSKLATRTVDTSCLESHEF
jgi:hypothetical protein